MVAPRLGCTHTPCFTPPTQRTCRTNTASPQVGPGSTRPAGRTASTRPGPAQALYVDSDKSRLSWVTPIRSAPIDLVSGDKGYSYKWVAHLTMWQEPPSPSRLLATARPRSGSRIRTPGGTRVEVVYKATPRAVPSLAAALTSLILKLINDGGFNIAL